MSRTTTKTYELRHPDTGHTVFADFGSRSFAHFMSLGYSYLEANASGTVTGAITIEFRPKHSDFEGNSLASAPVDAVASALVASAMKKSRAKPKAIPEAAHGNDNP